MSALNSPVFKQASCVVFVWALLQVWIELDQGTDLTAKLLGEVGFQLDRTTTFRGSLHFNYLQRSWNVCLGIFRLFQFPLDPPLLFSGESGDSPPIPFHWVIYKMMYWSSSCLSIFLSACPVYPLSSTVMLFYSINLTCYSPGIPVW